LPSIKILPEILRNQIAAGEVVERPASALKELLENAVDAEATEIEIFLEDGGIKKIELRDNGQGMSREDAILSVKRHATSKISKKEDLFNIQTLGFRGEALASIASVSIFTLETKQEKGISGTKIEIHAGYELETQDCACQKGTRVIVEDLFENIPARKKFLKTQNTELKNCLQVVENVAFVHPEINIKLFHNGKEIFKCLAENKNERVENIIGKELFSKLIPVQESLDFIHIKGFVSKPGEAFKTRNNQKIFVNGRSVKDSTVMASVNDAYHSFLERGAYPAFYLFITISPDLVDVNVHPQKSEIRFMRGQEVFQVVKNTILKAFNSIGNSLGHSSEIGDSKYLKLSQNVSKYESFSSNRKSFHSAIPSFKNPSKSQVSVALNFSKTILESKSSSFDFKDEDELQGYKIIGQAAKKFIILEKDEKIIFLDQHAVHERARYDEFMNILKNKESKSQRLLFPEIINCNSQEFLSIQEHINFFQNIGFEIEEFGNNTFQINSVPQQISEENLKETILKTAEELGEKGESKESEKNIEKALTYLACRGSVMFGDELNKDELKSIVKKWINSAKGLTCPHGRSLGFEMSVKELEKKVGR